MKTLNITFEDKEYKRLIKAKNGKNLSWHDFILSLVDKEESTGEEQ
ncbi:MAG: hypothetical protein Q7J68_07600 [Thermoplasmata archaeon]|nr:hypothetical protein [Thermoplasmata archaeon]